MAKPKHVTSRAAKKNLRKLMRSPTILDVLRMGPDVTRRTKVMTVGYGHALPGNHDRKPKYPERVEFAPPPDYVHIPLEDASAAERKGAPIVTGCLDYFPDALLEVAMLSKVGNDQHNPGEPLHWARGKSGDEADTAVRHMMARGTRDKDGVRHSIKVAWRALANAQKEIEAERADGKISRGSTPQ